MTEVQQITLDAVRQMHAETGRPVGSAALAARMGRSRTTAFEALFRLEGLGLVKADRTSNRRRFIPVDHRNDTIRDAAAFCRSNGNAVLAQRLEALEVAC